MIYSTIQDPFKMWIHEIWTSFKIASFPKAMALIFGITLTQVNILIGILIALAGGIVSIVFAIRKHMKREQSNRSKLILETIKALKDIPNSPIIDGMTLSQMTKLAENYLEQSKS